MSRVEWLKFVMRRGRRRSLARQAASFLAFEAYYQLCKLMGYKARHFLEPLPEEARAVPPGGSLLLIWPHFPLPVRLLDRIFPPGRIAHAECVPYSPEAEAAARASGRRFAVVDTVPGEFKVM